MVATALTALLAALPLALAQSSDETVLGVYMFHRHGDRTPKVLAPTNLTDLGYREVFQSGKYYRSRYIDSGANHRISGINSDEVLQSQLQASAPIDTVLQNSATGFLQALYPPVGSPADMETLADGSSVTAPMDGYQLIPISIVESGSGSENTAWLQDTSACYNAEISSNQYLTSTPYNKLYESTMDFYQKLLPAIKPMFNESTANFKNSYLIWDYINVAEIHNTTVAHSDLLDKDTVHKLFTLANTDQFNLAYNASSDIRAIAGKQLAGQVVQFLESTIEAAGSQTGAKFAVQFGAYPSFTSFFGLADMLPLGDHFYGITNYASSMVFEMFTKKGGDVTSANFPAKDDIYVRFMYHNGTATDDSPPKEYPLFGTGKNEIKWNDFVNHMDKFSIAHTSGWCHACGNTTGICEPYASGSGSSSSSSGTESGSCEGYGNGLSPAVNGVIGAMVTLAVVLGIEALLMLALGLTCVRRKKLYAMSNGTQKA